MITSTEKTITICVESSTDTILKSRIELVSLNGKGSRKGEWVRLVCMNEMQWEFDVNEKRGQMPRIDGDAPKDNEALAASLRAFMENPG